MQSEPALSVLASDPLSPHTFIKPSVWIDTTAAPVYIVRYAKDRSFMAFRPVSTFFVLPDFRRYNYIADCPLWPQRALYEVDFSATPLKMGIPAELFTVPALPYNQAYCTLRRLSHYARTDESDRSTIDQRDGCVHIGRLVCCPSPSALS